MTKTEFLEKWTHTCNDTRIFMGNDLDKLIGSAKDEAIADHLRYQKDCRSVYEKMLRTDAENSKMYATSHEFNESEKAKAEEKQQSTVSSFLDKWREKIYRCAYLSDFMYDVSKLVADKMKEAVKEYARQMKEKGLLKYEEKEQPESADLNWKPTMHLRWLDHEDGTDTLQQKHRRLSITDVAGIEEKWFNVPIK